MLQKRNKKFPIYSKKVKKLIKNTAFKLLNIHQVRGVLRTPSNTQDKDSSKNS